jgi:hypothetical protein
MAESFLLEVLINDQPVEVMTEVQAFWYNENLEGSSTFYLHATSNEREKWDHVITDPEPQNIKLHWGYLLQDTPVWSRWKKVLFSFVRYRLTPTGIELWIKGVDAGFVLSERIHGLSFVDQPISSMVVEFAQKNGFGPRNRVITPTRGQFSTYQGKVSDAQFIRTELLPRAVSTAGRADYIFGILDGQTLIFSPPDLSSVVKSFQLQLTPTEIREGDVPKIDIQFRRLFRAHELTHSVECRSFDRSTKEPLVWVATDKTSRTPKLATYRPKVPEVPGSVLVIAEDTFVEVKDRAETTANRNAKRLFEATVETILDLDVYAGGVINIVTTDWSGLKHWSSGTWLVTGVKTWFKPSGTGTTMTLARRERE